MSSSVQRSELILEVGAVANRLRPFPHRMDSRVGAYALWEHSWIVAVQNCGLLIGRDLPRLTVRDILLDAWDRNAPWP